MLVSAEVSMKKSFITFGARINCCNNLDANRQLQTAIGFYTHLLFHIELNQIT